MVEANTAIHGARNAGQNGARIAASFVKNKDVPSADRNAALSAAQKDERNGVAKIG